MTSDGFKDLQTKLTVKPSLFLAQRNAPEALHTRYHDLKSTENMGRDLHSKTCPCVARRHRHPFRQFRQMIYVVTYWMAKGRSHLTVPSRYRSMLLVPDSWWNFGVSVEAD